MSAMNSIFCCICKTFSKDHKKFDKILSRGQEKVEKFINAEFIYETLKEHQRLLSNLMPKQVKF
jgi:hypothetical protein